MSAWADLMDLADKATGETMLNKTKRQESEVSELYEDLDKKLDADEFAKLDRTTPWLTTLIRQLVQRGETPEDIVSHILGDRAHKWVEAQMIRIAARHAVREIE